jgi:hypothetical protein
MRYTTLTAVGIFFLLTIVQGCQTAEDASHIVSTPTLPDPHHHVVDVSQGVFHPQTAADFEVVEVPVEPDLERESVTVNPEGTWRAFATFGQTCRIFIEEVETGRTYEMRGVFLPWRPFSDLVWVSNNILVFDVWSQPHYGIHYAVDTRERKLVLASPFPDRLPDASEDSTSPPPAPAPPRVPPRP